MPSLAAWDSYSRISAATSWEVVTATAAWTAAREGSPTRWSPFTTRETVARDTFASLGDTRLAHALPNVE